MNQMSIGLVVRQSGHTSDLIAASNVVPDVAKELAMLLDAADGEVAAAYEEALAVHAFHKSRLEKLQSEAMAPGYKSMHPQEQLEIKQEIDLTHKLVVVTRLRLESVKKAVRVNAQRVA